MKHPNKAVTPLLPLGAALMACSLSFNSQADEATTHADDDTVLSTVKVEGSVDAEPDGYRATQTRIGKTLQDPHDIPQAVTSVTRALMDEQQAASLREALRNVSGLTFNAAEGGRSGDNMMLRGFYTFGDMYLDGIRDTAQYNRETFNLERVDVLRGAGAMLFGRGQAGGVINQVSKTPKTQDEQVLTGGLGSDAYRELTGDFNKTLGENSAIRVNVMQRGEGSWRANPVTGDEPELNRDGLALSLGLGLDTDDEFLLSHVRTRTDDKPDYGVSFDATTRKPQTLFSPDTYWGTDRNFDKSTADISTATYTHVFSSGSEWRTQLRYADYERSYWARTPNLSIAPNAGGLVCTQNSGTTNCNGGPTRTLDYVPITLQSDFNNTFDLFGMQHALLVGLEYLREDSFRHSLQNFGDTTAANPPFFLPYQANTTGTPVKFDSDSYATYVQDTVEFIPKWKATLGLRRDEMDATYSSVSSPKLKYGEWSTRSALSFHPVEETHYYLAFSDSFSPTADLYQLTVTPLPAERSQVLELGAKSLLLQGDLALRAALYRADKAWERNTDLESTAAVLTKKRRTDGLELEAAGRVNDKWELFSGLALMDSRILEVAENVDPNTGVITRAHSGYQGQRSRNTPPHTFNVWTTYKLPQHWKVGGGVESKGERYGYNPSRASDIPTLPGSSDFHPNTAPSYARVDALVAYEQKTWAVRLNVQNLFDTLYYDAIYDNGGFTVPGNRRKTILTLEYRL